MSTPQLSVVIPVYNEEQGLQALFDRLYPALDKLVISYEIVFVNDGSRDRSAAILREQFQRRPEVTRVILFNGNFGQHMAIMAGFEQSRGQRTSHWMPICRIRRRRSPSCSPRWTRALITSARYANSAAIAGGGMSRRAR